MSNKKTIIIMAVVDVVGVLASDSLEGNIYLFDNNKMYGSLGQGTGDMKTMLTFSEGDEIRLIWNITSLEPESYADISQIIIDKKYIKVDKKRYAGSDIAYWTGLVKKPFERLSYQFLIKVGGRDMEFACKLDLIGNLPAQV